MTDVDNEVEGFTWLINKFVRDVPGVRHALVVSSDGLRLAVSEDLDAEKSEQLAAVASGLISLAQGVSRLFDKGSCERTVVRMEHGHLFIIAIDEGSCFTVLAKEKSDMKVIAYQMAKLADTAGHVLTPQFRSRLREARAG